MNSALAFQPVGSVPAIDEAEPNVLVGFKMPESIPELPSLESSTSLLKGHEEVALGYRIQMLSLKMLGAMAADGAVVERLATSIISAISATDNSEQAAKMVFHGDRWIRYGTVPNGEFTKLVRANVAKIFERLFELRSVSKSNQIADLFNATALENLREAVCTVLPHDALISQAASQFKQRCEDINNKCRALIRFIATDLRITPKAAHRISCWNWISPTLHSACLRAGGYETAFIPSKAKKAFREGLLLRQQAIVECAENADVPLTQMLYSWDEFWVANRELESSIKVFVGANVRLAETVIRDYRFAQDQLQVRSSAQLGLLRAVQLFAPEMGWKFSTYAVMWIRQTVLRDLAKQDLIKLPSGSHAALAVLRKLLSERPNVSMEEMVNATKLSEQEVSDLIYFINYYNSVSMDTAFANDSGEFEGIHNHIADENGDFVEDLVNEDVSSYIQDVLSEVLDAREVKIVIGRYGIGGEPELTLTEMGAQLGLSVERVRQIANRAIEKLRESEYGNALLDLH
jgi:RNA polymerase sigma factor (sigma-70 family)